MKRVLNLLFMLFTLFLYSSRSCTYATQLSLENTDIDVVYCYADLWDQNLHRGELDNSIAKDYDNQELRYSLRSVLKNIPWIRKIFIVMPNDKVRFLRDSEEINDKIVYVKNEDIVGFDTNSPHVKGFNLWKLKDFGCSNHIIYMDDDFFIGKPLKKSDFFYLEKDKVVPYVLKNTRENTRSLKNTCDLKRINSLINKIKDKNNGQHPESNDGWRYQVLSSYAFLIKHAIDKNYLNLPGYIVELFHFAYGINLDELKEIYDILKNSEYAESSLRTKVRSNESLMPPTVYPVYTLNKYNRESRCISTKYIDLAKCNNANFDVELFVINNSGHNYKNYTVYDFYNARKAMKGLFPEPTPYEIPNLKLDIFDFDEVKYEKLSDLQQVSQKKKKLKA